MWTFLTTTGLALELTMLMTTHWAYAAVLMSSMIFVEVDVKVSVFSGVRSLIACSMKVGIVQKAHDHALARMPMRVNPCPCMPIHGPRQCVPIHGPSLFLFYSLPCVPIHASMPMHLPMHTHSCPLVCPLFNVPWPLRVGNVGLVAGVTLAIEWPPVATHGPHLPTPGHY